MGSAAMALAVGYVLTSFLESFYHENLQHSSLTSLWGRFYNYWKPAARLSHHVIHHQRTFRTRNNLQFASEQERVDTEKFITETMPEVVTGEGHGCALTVTRGPTFHALPNEQLADVIKREQFGVTWELDTIWQGNG